MTQPTHNRPQKINHEELHRKLAEQRAQFFDNHRRTERDFFNMFRMKRVRFLISRRIFDFDTDGFLAFETEMKIGRRSPDKGIPEILN